MALYLHFNQILSTIKMHHLKMILKMVLQKFILMKLRPIKEYQLKVIHKMVLINKADNVGEDLERKIPKQDYS